jgi:hypothetical protein
MLIKICVSRPTTLIPLIILNDLNIRNIIVAKERLCRIPKIQKSFVLIIVPLIIMLSLTYNYFVCSEITYSNRIYYTKSIRKILRNTTLFYEKKF